MKKFSACRRMALGRHSVPIYVSDHDNPDNVIVLLGVTPETLEFLTDRLPQDDGFTKELYAIRDEAMVELWGRHS